MLLSFRSALLRALPVLLLPALPGETFAQVALPRNRR